MTDFDESVFWDEFKDVGFLRPVRVKQKGRAVANVDVKWSQPNSELLGSQSIDYQMEYQHSDLPALAEGDPVTLLDADGNVISGGKYEVRSSPFVPPDPANSRSGFFRQALLTKL